MATTITSDQDLKIYKDENHFRIFAGPGAGKTHLLIENIKLIVEHSKQIKLGIKKVLCITYTNAAADEIIKRLGSYNKYTVVSTIHSFINEYFLKQFQPQLKLQVNEDFAITIPSNINLISQQEGFSTLSEKSKEEIFAFIKDKYSSILSNEYEILSMKKMLEVVIDISPVNKINSTGAEKVYLKFVDISKQAAQAIKDFTWSVAGKLSFDEILYFGWKLISGNELIAHMIRVEFPYIMIDEYQDTNPIQNFIIRKISEKGVIITVVGDIAQSIYSFQGASYLDFKNFTLPSSLPIVDYVIEGNRRSTENIILLLNYLRKSDVELKKQFCVKNNDENPNITFIIQKDKKHLERPIRTIIGKDTKILCRKWDEAFSYVDDISDDQKKLLSNLSGAYTYQLNRDLFTEVEAKQEYWIDLARTFSTLEKAYRTKSLPEFLDIIGRYVNIKDLFSSFNVDKGKQLNLLITFWDSMFSNIDDSKPLKDIAIIANTKIKETGLEMIGEFKYPLTNGEDYFEPIYQYVDKMTYRTAKKIVDDIFVEDSNYMTIHRAKGKEFDSVLVNGEPFAKEKNIAQVLWVIKNPIIISNVTDEKLLVVEEYTRLLYVGYSRAINKLYIHLYGNENTEKEIVNAINNYYKSMPKFYDFEYC